MNNIIYFYFINYINIDNQQNLTGVIVEVSLDIRQGTRSLTCCNLVLTLIIIVITYIIIINNNHKNWHKIIIEKKIK